MPRPQVSVIKRQREQAKRERQQVKAERRAQRKSAKLAGEGDGEGELNDIVVEDDVLKDA